MHHRGSLIPVLCLFCVVLDLCGCAYVLHPVAPSLQQRIRVLAKSPEEFSFRSKFTSVQAYDVPADGRVTLDFPAHRPGCTALLFGIPITRPADRYNSKSIEVTHAGKLIRKLSIKDVSALPTQADGYHVLRLDANHSM